MSKKNIILFILFFIILIGAIIIICMNFKESTNDKILEVSFVNNEDSSFSNILENAVTEVANDIIENVTNENTIENNIVTEVVATTTTPSKSTTKSNSNNNTTASKNTSSVTTPQTSTDKEDNKTNTKFTTENNPTKSENVTDKNQNTSSTTPQDTTKKEDTTTNVEHPELAYSTYRVTNTAIVPEIISILKSEIAKDKELVDFGTTAISTNKTNAYNNTSGFTYLFVKDITKGKVAGNYQSFPERVRNTVGAFGTYYVYAEDEYTYDGRGLNPKWSQTLVWIYVRF